MLQKRDKATMTGSAGTLVTGSSVAVDDVSNTLVAGTGSHGSSMVAMVAGSGSQGYLKYRLRLDGHSTVIYPVHHVTVFQHSYHRLCGGIGCFYTQ